MLNPLNLGISGGVVWGVSMFVCTILSMYIGYSTEFLNLMASIYPGYTITWWGSIVGLVYGFADAFIGLFILGWIYNRLSEK